MRVRNSHSSEMGYTLMMHTLVSWICLVRKANLKSQRTCMCTFKLITVCPVNFTLRGTNGSLYAESRESERRDNIIDEGRCVLRTSGSVNHYCRNRECVKFRKAIWETPKYALNQSAICCINIKSKVQIVDVIYIGDGKI